MKIIFLLLVIFLTSLVVADSGSRLADIPLKDIDGKPTSLKKYEGKVVLLVNVASQCGLTPQYTALQAIHAKFKDKGFTVVGVPCNDFGSQAPGTNDEIKQFCSAQYQMTFPLLDKIHVKGSAQHPLYAKLTGKDAAFPGDIKWNFGKFLLGRDGKVLKRFEPAITPDAPEVLSAIEAALGGK